MIFALGLVGLFDRVRESIESFDGLVFWGWVGGVFIIGSVLFFGGFVCGGGGAPPPLFIIGLPPIRLLLDVRFGGSSFALTLPLS
jgi:hypothetical protein